LLKEVLLLEKPHKLSKKKREPSNSDSEQNKVFDIYIKERRYFDELEKRLESLKKDYELDDKSILKLIKEKDKIVNVPASVFNNSLAPLEAVVLFLKEHLGYSFHNIALLLKRDDRTIWLTYSNAAKKKVALEVVSEFNVPVSIFSDRKFSILESAAAYFVGRGLSFKQISELLGKNPKTLWTVYSRYTKKGGKKGEFSSFDSEQSRIFEILIKEREALDELGRIFERLKDSYGMGYEEVLKLIKEKDKIVHVPASVFNNSLAPLEAVVLFLKEHLGYSFHKIALLLKRDDRTIWLTHRNAVKKKVALEVVSEFNIPVSIFSDRKFSILESAVAYFVGRGLSLKQISELFGKNPKTIWTVYHRYKIKLKLKNE